MRGQDDDTWTQDGLKFKTLYLYFTTIFCKYSGINMYIIGIFRLGLKLEA